MGALKPKRCHWAQVLCWATASWNSHAFLLPTIKHNRNAVMAITNEDLERVKNQLEIKIHSVSVDHVNMAQAIGSYAERFNGVEERFKGVDARLDTIDLRLDALSADFDRRFEAQAAEIDRRFKALDARFDAFDGRSDGRFDRMESNFHRLEQRMERRTDRLDDKLDARFNVQTVLMMLLGILVLFGDVIRPLIGL